MKTLHIKLLFPKNWYHSRFLKVSSKNNLVTTLMHGDSQQIQVDDSITSIHWKLDYFKNSISIPDNEKEVYIILFMDIGKGIIQPYLKTLKVSCIQGKIVSQTEFENTTSSSIYLNNQNWINKANLDQSTVALGLMIGIISMVYSVYSETEWRELLFLLGGGTILSLLTIILEKRKIVLGDYKARMWASIGIFIFILLIIPSRDYVVQILIFILTIGFTIRFISHMQKLKHAILKE